MLLEWSILELLDEIPAGIGGLGGGGVPGVGDRTTASPDETLEHVLLELRGLLGLLGGRGGGEVLLPLTSIMFPVPSVNTSPSMLSGSVRLAMSDDW